MLSLKGGKLTADRPNLRIVEPHLEYYEELSNDALSIRGYEQYRINDYHLGMYQSCLFFLLLVFNIVASLSFVTAV